MKRIILGLSLVLILVQNGFALTEAELNRRALEVLNSTLDCANAAEKYFTKESTLQKCIEAVNVIQKYYEPGLKGSLSQSAFNTGLIYYEVKNNKIKAYEYWFLAAKYGNKSASKNLSIMCKQDPWACK